MIDGDKPLGFDDQFRGFGVHSGPVGWGGYERIIGVTLSQKIKCFSSCVGGASIAKTGLNIIFEQR